jgi:hypothetical protein
VQSPISFANLGMFSSTSLSGMAMARIITKELALKIVGKLGARPIATSKNAAHDQYGVYHQGVLLATLGIRRASSKDIGHDFIPRQLNVNTSLPARGTFCS